MRVSQAREELLDTVLKSPAAVAAGDKAAWVGIFAHLNIVEDPVGSKPHYSGIFDAKVGKRCHGPLERFFETFIAPNDIRFHVDRDIVCENHVVRDLTIEIRMSPTVAVHVPMHLLYELVDEDGDLKIARLAAHWELWPMIKQLLAKGRDCLGVLLGLGWRMLSIQGVGGALGFCQGFLGIGQQGKSVVHDVARALSAGDDRALQRCFSADAKGVALPVSPPGLSHCEFEHYSLADLSALQGLKINVSKLLQAGYIVTCNIDVQWQNNHYQGVGIFEFNARHKKIDTVRLYWDGAEAVD